ncbi:hypothetical protein QBC37DRAFT_379140 [Rhypophila decipiens]|uniref:Uncharacterized protein n=1 Tax=Rhypophila decipiens TaxID=261697 RepID=A0AAN6XWT4_9PEZI|nr:hypothetical protein QBC37DRAFT_379140 [Rhypophila decipiens]
MFSSCNKKGSKREALVRLFRLVTATSKPAVLSEPGKWRNEEDHDYFEHPTDDDELFSPFVSKTLYERMVAYCLEGEIFPPDRDFTYEEQREKAIRTFIGGLIAVSTTAVGAADLAREDKTRPHKQVVFFNPDDDLQPEVVYPDFWWCCRKKTDIDDVESDCSDSVYETCSEGTTNLVEVEPLAPNIVERFILCQCKTHEHCLTCHMAPKTFNLVVKEAYKDISQSPSTRWLLALRCLDRSFQIWVGEHVQYLINPPAGRQEWQTPADSIDSATLTCIRDLINLSYGISFLRSRRARFFGARIRKLVKFSKGFNDSIAKIALAETSRDAEKMKAKCVNYKKMITIKIKDALDLLEKLERSLLRFIHGRVRDLRDDILRNFDLTNSNGLAGSSTWPAYAVRKITFMNEVLIGVYGDFMNLVPLFKSMHEVWREEVSKDDIFTWSESVQRHISFWGKWHDEANEGLAALTNWSEVSDRGKDNCTESHGYS